MSEPLGPDDPGQSRPAEWLTGDEAALRTALSLGPTGEIREIPSVAITLGTPAAQRLGRLSIACADQINRLGLSGASAVLRLRVTAALVTETMEQALHGGSLDLVQAVVAARNYTLNPATALHADTQRALLVERGEGSYGDEDLIARVTDAAVTAFDIVAEAAAGQPPEEPVE